MRFIPAILALCISGSALAAPVNTDEIDRRIKKLMERSGMVGLSVAIVENGELTYAKGYGETLKGSKDPVTSDTVFRWASVSKGVAAATILKLSEDGHFGLTSPAKAHAPSLSLPKSNQMVRIEDILSHRTGLVRNAYDNRIEGGQAAKTVRRALKELPPVCEAGDCHTYQNVAFDAAAEMTETATRMPYKAVVSERIFKPLGMDTASVTLAGLLRSKNWAKPHSRKGNIIDKVKPTYYRIPAAAGVNSSVKDLAKWMQAQMPGTSQSLPQNIRDTLQTTRVRTLRENRIMRRNFHALSQAQYGLGWRVYDYEGRRVIGHRGAVQGYRALVLFDPGLRTGVALMWNSTDGRPVGLQLEIMDQVYGKPRRDWMRLEKK